MQGNKIGMVGKVWYGCGRCGGVVVVGNECVNCTGVAAQQQFVCMVCVVPTGGNGSVRSKCSSRTVVPGSSGMRVTENGRAYRTKE